MSKSYHLKLSEENYNNLDDNGKQYLNYLGLEVRQVPTDEELKDPELKRLKNESSANYHALQKYLFEKRHK